MLSREYRDDHINSLMFWIKHGGPHVLWLGGVLFALYQVGWIDKPAWSADITEVQGQIEEIQKDVGSVKTDLQDIKIQQVEQKTQAEATNKALDSISQQLNILINRGLNGQRR